MISYHISYCFYLFIRFQSFSRCSSEDICCYIRNVNPLKSKCFFFFGKMRCFIMFVTAVCVLFLLKLKWPKNKSVYDIARAILVIRR